MTERIAVFGGAFDPVTIGHLFQVSELLSFQDKKGPFLSSVWIVPCGDNRYDKITRCNSETRMEMFRTAMSHYFGGNEEVMNKIVIKDTEVRKGQFIPTHELWEIFKVEKPSAEFWFVVGSDVLPRIQTWKNPDYVLNEVAFLVVPRPEIPDRDPTAIVRMPKKVVHLSESSQIKAAFDVSSTVVRHRLKRFWTSPNPDKTKLHLSLDGLITAPVVNIIYDRQLFK